MAVEKRPQTGADDSSPTNKNVKPQTVNPVAGKSKPPGPAVVPRANRGNYVPVDIQAENKALAEKMAQEKKSSGGAGWLSNILEANGGSLEWLDSLGIDQIQLPNGYITVIKNAVTQWKFWGIMANLFLKDANMRRVGLFANSLPHEALSDLLHTAPPMLPRLLSLVLLVSIPLLQFVLPETAEIVRFFSRGTCQLFLGIVLAIFNVWGFDFPRVVYRHISFGIQAMLWRWKLAGGKRPRYQTIEEESAWYFNATLHNESSTLHHVLESSFLSFLQVVFLLPFSLQSENTTELCIWFAVMQLAWLAVQKKGTPEEAVIYEMTFNTAFFIQAYMLCMDPCVVEVANGVMRCNRIGVLRTLMSIMAIGFLFACKLADVAAVWNMDGPLRRALKHPDTYVSQQLYLPTLKKQLVILRPHILQNLLDFTQTVANKSTTTDIIPKSNPTPIIDGPYCIGAEWMTTEQLDKQCVYPACFKHAGLIPSQTPWVAAAFFSITATFWGSYQWDLYPHASPVTYVLSVALCFHILLNVAAQGGFYLRTREILWMWFNLAASMLTAPVFIHVLPVTGAAAGLVDNSVVLFFAYFAMGYYVGLGFYTVMLETYKIFLALDPTPKLEEKAPLVLGTKKAVATPNATTEPAAVPEECVTTTTAKFEAVLDDDEEEEGGTTSTPDKFIVVALPTPSPEQTQTGDDVVPTAASVPVPAEEDEGPVQESIWSKLKQWAGKDKALVLGTTSPIESIQSSFLSKSEKIQSAIAGNAWLSWIWQGISFVYRLCFIPRTALYFRAMVRIALALRLPVGPMEILLTGILWFGYAYLWTPYSNYTMQKAAQQAEKELVVAKPAVAAPAVELSETQKKQ